MLNLNRLVIFLLIPLAFVLLPRGLFAEGSLKDILSGKEGCDQTVCNDICELIKNNIKRGVDAKAVVSTSIQLGNSVCHVIKCAIEGSGEDLTPVVAGAMEAGSTPDVVSRCCIEAGAKPATVARTLQAQAPQNVAGSPGQSVPGYEPVPADPVPATGPNPGGTISPSSF